MWWKSARKGAVGSLALRLPLAILTVLLWSPSQAALPQRVEAPAVVMDTTRRDFGDVFAGEELEQIFLVRNAGTKPLELSQKSTIGAGAAAPRFVVAAVLTRPRSQYLTRTVAARRAAPS